MSSTLNRFLQTLPWNQPIKLPDNHQWKYANQPALLDWKIKARPYNTTVANSMFVFILCATLIFSYFLLYENAKFSLIETIFIAAPGFLLFFLALYGTTHQKTKFAYRLTETGIEVCEWKAPGNADDRLGMAGSCSSNSITLLRHLHTHMNRIMPPILHVAVNDPLMLIAVQTGDAQGWATGGGAQG